MPRKKETPAGKGRKNAPAAPRIAYEEFALRLKESREQNKNGGPLEVFEGAGIEFPLAILGSEELRVSRLLTWLRDSVFGDQVSFNIYFGTELTSANAIAPVISSLRSMPLFSSIEVAAVLYADKLKTAQVDALVEASRLAGPASLLIITAPGAKAKNPFAALLSHCKSVIEIPALKRAELPAWISKEVRRLGAAGGIDQEAVQALAAAYEGDLQTLAQELGKLTLVVDSDRPITAKAVQEVCQGAPERTTFQLIHLIAQRNAVRANALLNDLIDQGLHPLQISGLLNRAFRTMLAHRSSSRETRPLLHEDLTNQWFSRNISGAVDKFSEQDLAAAVHALCSLDMELKSSGLPAPARLEHFVARASLRAF